jgi:hypothetical protein
MQKPTLLSALQQSFRPKITEEITPIPALGQSPVATVQTQSPELRPLTVPPAPPPPQTQFPEMGSNNNQPPAGDAPWYDNANLWNSLALGFNSMRLNPDQGLAAVIGDRIKTSNELSANNKTAMAVANALRAKGLTQEAELVSRTPSLAGDFAKLLTKGNTDAVETREQVANLLGYEKGTPEYKAIIAGGKPSDLNQQKWDRSKSIRGEFVAIPAVKSFSEQSQAFGRIVASADDPSPAGDLALIFNYMKILDPGSTVREGEFANAQNAGGVDDRVRSLFNQLYEGTRLTESQRADFVNRAQRLYANAEQGYAKTENFYRGIAERSGLKPEDVVPDYRYGGSQPPKMLVRPAEVPQATWDAMTREQKQQFLDAGR